MLLLYCIGEGGEKRQQQPPEQKNMYLYIVAVLDIYPLDYLSNYIRAHIKLLWQAQLPLIVVLTQTLGIATGHLGSLILRGYIILSNHSEGWKGWKVGYFIIK